MIGCPCALVISTPAAIAASLSAGARRGLLLKGGAVLENLGKITTAAFDKTGTLTEGKPKVTDVIGFGRDRGRRAAPCGRARNRLQPSAGPRYSGPRQGWRVMPPAAEGGEAVGGKGVTGRVWRRCAVPRLCSAASEHAALDA